MNYYVLLNIFPPEIVNIIYKFILIQKSGEKILHNIRYYHLKNSILYTSLDNMLKTSLLNNNFSLISNDNILFLDFILKNYYSKKNLTSSFWYNYLNMLSAKIMEIHNIHKYDNIIIYQSLKKIIALWFALCIKFNISLKLGIKKHPNNISNSDYNIISVNSNNIKKIKNFNNFVFPPIVLDNYNNEIDTQDSFYTLVFYRDFPKILLNPNNH